jgi:hypothetical protein
VDHYGGAATTLMNRMIIAGGCTDIVESYDHRVSLAERKWKLLCAMPDGGRCHHSMVTINDYCALVIGGISANRMANDWNAATLPIYELDTRGKKSQWIIHNNKIDRTAPALVPTKSAHGTHGSVAGSGIGGPIPRLPYHVTMPSVTRIDDTIIIMHSGSHAFELDHYHRNRPPLNGKSPHMFDMYHHTYITSDIPKRRTAWYYQLSNRGNNSIGWQSFDVPSKFLSNGPITMSVTH